MDKRDKRTIVICDTDLDHSFTLEGELRNQNYDVVNISDASELVSSVKSLKPSVVLANPDIKGFNEQEVCKQIMNEMGIPVILLLDDKSAHTAQIGNCRVENVVTKPAQIGNLLMFIKKHIALYPH